VLRVVVGALLAVPTAAILQVGLREIPPNPDDAVRSGASQRMNARSRVRPAGHPDPGHAEPETTRLCP
jgi:hypothetical protein